MSKTNTHKVTLTEAEQFFYENAGYSHDPVRESAISGRSRGAVLLAFAASTGQARGWTVEWDIDLDADIIPSESYFVSGAQHWEALLKNADDEVIGYLGSVDLGFAKGTDGEPATPWGSPYAKVVSAQLMLEAL